jgi:hypothetical protein
MANNEHVALIKQGVAAWNNRRKNDWYPGTRPLGPLDLDEVNLGRADLVKVDLSRTSLK